MTIQFQPPCYVQGHQPPDQAAQSHIQPGLECLQGWGIHNFLGQHVPVRHHPLCEKNSLLISNPNLSCLSLRPFPLVLSYLLSSRKEKFLKTTVTFICLQGKQFRVGFFSACTDTSLHYMDILQLKNNQLRGVDISQIQMKERKKCRQILQPHHLIAANLLQCTDQ